jgi:hypothetical protein
MSMHISVIVQHMPGVHDLGYWEGDPPSVGDLIDVDGQLCQVQARYWRDCFDVRLLASINRTRWNYGEKWRDA